MPSLVKLLKRLRRRPAGSSAQNSAVAIEPRSDKLASFPTHEISALEPESSSAERASDPGAIASATLTRQPEGALRSERHTPKPTRTELEPTTSPAPAVDLEALLR